jgi:recombination endonuclease VII
MKCRIKGCRLKAVKDGTEGGRCWKHSLSPEALRKHYNGGNRDKRRPASKAINEQEWLAIYIQQQGQCALCEHRLWNRYSGAERNKKVERLAAVDHCHAIEKEEGIRASIRGLLCAYPCNRILRREMTADWLDNAADYVRMLPAQRVLTRPRTLH